MTEILAIIPARSGSKRLPSKNIMDFRGKPLIAHAIEQAKKSKHITRIIVVTDDSQTASIARQYNTEILNESVNLAQDKIPMQSVVKWALQYLEKYELYTPDYFILLQPTSPLRTTEDIDKAIKMITAEGAESLDSRCDGEQNGAIYICKPYVITQHNRDFIGTHHLVYTMAREDSTDIDDIEDFKKAERRTK